MEAKHTKGEWEVHYFGDNGNRKTRIHANNVTIANVLQIEEAEANAKLIAAAPELLEALIECKNLLEKTPYENLHLQDLVCNAINKATK